MLFIIVNLKKKKYNDFFLLLLQILNINLMNFRDYLVRKRLYHLNFHCHPPFQDL